MSVVPEDVRAMGQFAVDAAKDVLDALQSVAVEIDELTSADWLGDAGSAFGGAWRECRDGGVKVLHALAGMADKLGVNADAYQAIDAQNLGAIQDADQFRLSIAPTTFPGQLS